MLSMHYEYGVLIDEECRELIWKQIILSRQLYNDLVAAMRSVRADMELFIMDKAGDEAKLISAEIDKLSAAFKDAKAANDEQVMKSIADKRRAQWILLKPLLKETRSQYKVEIQEQYLSQIGNNSAARTYAIRCLYVDKGLGWATANDVLDRALTAWKKRFAQGKAPEFAKAADKRQDSLVLQFTAAGGLSVESVLTGKSKEISVLGNEFSFRLGAAQSNQYATGIINLHRPLPTDCGIPKARLVCERIADKERYRLQFIINREAAIAPAIHVKPLLAVHLGWAFDVSGRRIAGINDTTDPSTASLIKLPADIEHDLERASAVQSLRDEARDTLHPHLKEWPLTGIESLDTEIQAIQKLPAQYIDQGRLHRLIDRMLANGITDNPLWLREWRALDKKRWQAEVYIARRARNRRKNFYTELVRSWVKQYRAIVLEPLDLKEAAVKLNAWTGERGEFTKKARAGQRVAALFELVEIICWQAKKAGVAVFEERIESIKTCSSCGKSGMEESATDWHMLQCHHCGAVHDRKLNGASVLYQYAESGIGQRINHYHEEALLLENKKAIKKMEKLQKMQEGRRKARTLSANENRDDSC